MTLKQIIRIYALLLAIGCLNAFGQAAPATSAPASAPASTNTPAEIPASFESLPLRTIASVSSSPHGSNEVVHVHGAVLDQSPGKYIVIRDDTGTISAQIKQTLPIRMSALVDVWGNPAGDVNHLTLRRAVFRLADAADAGRIDRDAPSKPANLPVLTKVRQIRDLSPAEASWEYPVKLRAVVTMASAMRVFVQDDTAGIYVRVRDFAANVKTGDLVEIEGASNPGSFMPVVVPSKMTVLGTAPLPPAQSVSLFQMANGEYDSQWVEANGVVRGVSLAGSEVQLKLSDHDGTFVALLMTNSAPTNLMDSVVRIRGVCGSKFNNRRQITGVEMWIPSLDLIQIIEPAAADPFSLPTQPIISLSQAHGRAAFQRRAKIAGVVTACEAAKSFFVQDADDGVEVFPAGGKTAVQAGDRVEVAGYPALGDYGIILRDAVFRVTGSGTPPPAKRLSEDHPLDSLLNNLLVDADAQVAGTPETSANFVLPLQIGNTIFKARILPPTDETRVPTPGSVVHLSGVYQVLADDLRKPRGFQMVVPSGKNLQVTHSPSWWNIQHTMLAVGTLAVIAGVALLWVLLLRRRVAEQTAVLQHSEVKFRSLVEQSLVGVYAFQDGRFAYVNPRMAEIYGYSVEEMTAPAFTVHETVFEEDRPMVEEQIRRRMAGEISSAHYTLRARRKDGALVHVEVMGSLAEYNGKPAILGTAMDVTERKVTEGKLAEASNLLETLLDNSPDHIYFKDRSSRFVRCSKAFEGLFHVSDVNALKGKTDFDFFLVEHARAAFEDEQEIMRTGKPIIGKLETETHADGRITYALTTKMPWRDSTGNIIGTFGTSKNVTALKEAEAKLAYERDLFHALLENFPDVIYFKDLQSRFVRVSRSKAASSMKIVRTQERKDHPDEDTEHLPQHLKSVEQFGEWLLGKTDFDTFTEERARAAFEDEQKIIRTGEPVVAKVEKTPQADGRVTWCISTKMPWRNKDGETIGTFGVSKDITALKQAETELETAHQRLIETSRLAGMAEVATDVLHNVGNVLNSVNVSCSLTIDRVKGSKIGSLAKTAALLQENSSGLGEFFSKDPRGQQIPSYLAALAEHFGQEQSALLQELEQLLKHIEHIKQIVAMQQSYAKVAGVIETVNPTQLVDDAVHINGAALTRHDVQVRCEFEPVPMIQTEKHRVLQILVNLIRNAKYALDDSKRQDKLMTIKLGRNGGDHIKIQVIDNGVGIPAENLTRIFAHGFTTRSNGHGFGLHSSALAIKELGGSLTAHSDGVGKGATFTLILPEQPPTAAQEPK